MTKIKHFMRTIGEPNEQMKIISADDMEAELEYKFLNQGWTVLKVEYLGALRDDKGNELGYRILYILNKEDSVKAK